MNITRLRGGNAQFPEDKNLGDIVIISQGDIFCWDGLMWQLIGGRFIPRGMRELFLTYVKSGWPDTESAKFDLPLLLDLSVFTDYDSHDIIPADPKFIKKFIERVVEISGKFEKIN
jgi:hypothetical protein